ncbi:hypothetical protein CCMA1212_008531 [Trichoderma ghanense]|uniref:Uncharacterized protein n=1 Tax=Trichoderma ghanense TaxID=65468 RepID=A0ABY2GUQ2_9HYPO
MTQKLRPEDPGQSFKAQRRAQASADRRDISHAMPSRSAVSRLRPGPKIRGPHDSEFAAVPGTRDAHERTMGGWSEG